MSHRSIDAYVAHHDNRWLALLGWGAAALKCKARDQWIGWTQALKLQRLALVANNSRFLILPDVNVPNLASRVLALNLKRLSDDWLETHGHPIYLAETFVDPHQGAVLAQQEIPPTTNEITMVKTLLDPVELEGAVVTADAIHTQREPAAYLVEDKKADYVFTVKDNQARLREAIEDLNLVDFPPSAPNVG